MNSKKRTVFAVFTAICFLALKAGAQVPAFGVIFIELEQQFGMDIHLPGGWQNFQVSVSPNEESASFSGIMTIKGVNLGSILGSSPAGGYNFELLESVGGPLSDILNVSWAPTVFQDQNSTLFVMNFTSETEGQTLQPPGTGTIPPGGVALETGELQTWEVPGIPANLLIVGIQSDAPESVPDGGATILMLGFALSGTAGWRRFLGR